MRLATEFGLRFGMAFPAGGGEVGEQATASGIKHTTTMKKRAVVARLALVALIFVAIFMMGRTFAASSVAARPVKLVITGPTGQGFIGIYVADGVTNSVSAVAPATVEFQAKDVTYEFLRDGGQGEARVELFVENLSRTSATSGERHGVMGWLRYSTGKESYGAGDF